MFLIKENFWNLFVFSIQLLQKAKLIQQFKEQYQDDFANHLPWSSLFFLQKQSLCHATWHNNTSASKFSLLLYHLDYCTSVYSQLPLRDTLSWATSRISVTFWKDPKGVASAGDDCTSGLLIVLGCLFVILFNKRIIIFLLDLPQSRQALKWPWDKIHYCVPLVSAKISPKHWPYRCIRSTSCRWLFFDFQSPNFGTLSNASEEPRPENKDFGKKEVGSQGISLSRLRHSSSFI